ncbi:MAG TPA: hypothetical protein DHV12_02745 [Thermotogae bacterium]|nr:hypothetical protein [Thermotogota bacterium]
MLKTLKLVEQSEFVVRHEILDFKRGESFYYIKLKLLLKDGSELYIREYVSKKEYLYSYHWQDKDGTLRARWDNAPHHKGLKSFPHHKHKPNIVEESQEIGLEEVLKVIEKEMKQ